MTADTPSSAPATTIDPTAPRRRPFDWLGLVGLFLGLLVFAPSLFVFLVGLIPEMNPIWWLGIVLLPLLGIGGLLAVVFGIVGILVARRRGGRFALSIVSLVLGALMVVPPALLYVPTLLEG